MLEQVNVQRKAGDAFMRSPALPRLQGNTSKSWRRGKEPMQVRFLRTKASSRITMNPEYKFGKFRQYNGKYPKY